MSEHRPPARPPALPLPAEAVLQALEAIPTGKWNATAAGEDYAHNNISHQVGGGER